MRAPGCSRATVYIYERLTDSLFVGLPLQTHLSFLVPYSLWMYVHTRDRTFDSFGCSNGVPNIPSLSYESSCVNVDIFHSSQLFRCCRNLRVNLELSWSCAITFITMACVISI